MSGGFFPDGRIIGEVIAYRFDDTPAGWLEMDGSTLNTDEYPLLAKKYGKSNDRTFQLEDWRDVPLWGAGVDPLGSVVGSDTEDFRLGRTDGSLQVDLTGATGSGVDPSKLTVLDKRPKRGLIRWLIRSG